jgi:enoyl-CoA hydratase/carnithine racemase
MTSTTASDVIPSIGEPPLTAYTRAEPGALAAFFQNNQQIQRVRAYPDAWVVEIHKYFFGHGTTLLAARDAAFAEQVAYELTR